MEIFKLGLPNAEKDEEVDYEHTKAAILSLSAVSLVAFPSLLFLTSVFA
jgi:hypothetical protein